MLLQRRMLQSRIKVGIYFKVTDLIINCCFCSPLPQVSSTQMWIYLRLKGAIIFFWCRGRHLRSLNITFKLQWLQMSIPHICQQLLQNHLQKIKVPSCWCSILLGVKVSKPSHSRERLHSLLHFTSFQSKQGPWTFPILSCRPKK